jgi:hypothetical protein
MVGKAGRALASLVVVVTGCASQSMTDPVGSGHGQCAQRAGTYRASYATRSGNCGDIPESIDSIATQPTTESQKATGCTGPGISSSADNCEVTFDQTCPNDGLEKGGRERVSGNAKWNTSATYGTSTVQITLTNAGGQVRCTGTYDVVITRQ